MGFVLIIGAKSDIAQAIAQEYAEKGYDLYLAARSSSELQSFASDLAIRNNIQAEIIELDVTAFDTHASIYQSLSEKPVGAVCVAGYLGDQQKAQVDFAETKTIIDTNYTGCVSILNVVAEDFRTKKSGFIVGISSVAGDRGRKSNYIYGSAKAAFTTYLSGLRNDLYQDKVHVLTVKPGFVNTAMTKDMDLPAKLTAEPIQVAKQVVKAQGKGKSVIYTKSIWKLIMLIIRHIPEFIFKRLSL